MDGVDVYATKQRGAKAEWRKVASGTSRRDAFKLRCRLEYRGNRVRVVRAGSVFGGAVTTANKGGA